MKSKHRPIIAKFDGPTWKKGGELVAVRPLVDFLPSNQTEYYPPWLVEWLPDNRYNIMMIPPSTAWFADHDCSDAYHSVECSDEAKDMSKYQ